MTLPNFSDAQVLAQLDSGWHWSGPVISYRYAVDTANLGGTTETLQFLAPNAYQQGALAIALRVWGDLIDRPLVQTSSSSSNIDFAYSGSLGGAYALTYFPSRGTIWMDGTAATLTNPVIGRYGFMAIVHEIGHALGLNHMGSYDGAGAWTPSSQQDSVVYTLMSYFGPNAFQSSPEVADADWIASNGQAYQPQTPMLNDIMAIQSIYGASTTTRLGDTVYGFGSAADDPIYNFNRNENPILTIYDSGGNDTLDLGGWSSDASVDLSPGSFSSANNMTRNIAIARNTLVENAIGGGGNDQLVGNGAANRIEGGSGNDLILGLDGNDYIGGGSGDDVIDGGNGLDTAVFRGTAGAHRLQRQSDGSIAVTGSDGNDTLVRVERLKFDDVSLAYDLDSSGTTGNALRLLQMITGSTQLGDKVLVGEGINLIATHGTAGVSRMLIDTGTAARYAGGSDDAHLLSMLFRNIVGTDPSQAELAELQAFVAHNHMSQSDALAYAAQLENTAQRIDLAGLAAQGVSYVEWAG